MRTRWRDTRTTITGGCIQYEPRRKTRHEFAVQIKVAPSVRTPIRMFAMILTSVSIVAGRQRISQDHRRMGASRGKIRRRRSASDDDPQRQQQSRRADAGQVRGREFFGKAYRRPRRRGACDARDCIYPACSRQHHHAQARWISRDVAADAATRHRRQIHVFDRFSKGWNDRKGGAGSLVTLNVVAAGRIGLKPRPFTQSLCQTGVQHLKFTKWR
jgi:hypothetical protein